MGERGWEEESGKKKGGIKHKIIILFNEVEKMQFNDAI